MPIGKKITNKNLEKKVTIEEILDNQNEETIIYRDIFNFLTPDILKSLSTEDKESESENNMIEEPEWNTSFRVRELANWVVDNNRKIKEEFKGSRINRSNQAHSKTAYITHKLNRLVDLSLLVRIQKIESRKNRKLVTDIFDITRNGVIIALTLEIEKHSNKSDQYGKILKFLYKEWKTFVPDGYRDHHNIEYYLIEEILDECLISNQNILLDFIKLIRKHSNGYDINFSILRYELHCLIFSKIRSDNKFKNSFYKIVNNFNIFKGLDIDPTDKKLEDLRKENLKLLKVQFKLDIESFIDKCFSEYLKIDSYSIKSFVWSSREDNQNKTVGEIHQNRHYSDIMNEIVLTFEVRKEWEKERNKNLTNFDRIVILVKCSSCGQIYPISFNLELESFSKIRCKYCNNLTISQYIFENEINAQYHYRIASLASRL